MATIKTPAAGVSPYQEAAAAPVVLRADANGNTVLANPTVAATDATATAATNATVIVNGNEALNSLIATSRSGVFEGANVTINLEEQLFNTTNQVTSTTNYAEGANGSIQYNNGSNGFSGDPYFTYDNSNVITPGIRTDGYFYSNGAPFTSGGNAAIGNFVFTGDNMTIAHANSTLSVTGNGTGNVNVTANGNTWTFSNNGNITFPDNSGSSWPINQQRFGMGNIGAWLDGQWTIGEFSGNGVSGTVGIRIDPAIEGPVGMTFPSGASSNTQPVQIYSTNGGGIELYTGSNNWSFGSDGTTTFPNNTINPGNNQPLTIRTPSSGNAYTIMYQSSTSWEAYAEDDNTGNNAAYAWIKADLQTANTPRVFITNAKGSDGVELTWTFDAGGNLTLPNIASTSINYANGQPYNLTNRIANGNTYANIQFPSGNLAVGVDITPVTGAWINTYGNIIVNGNNDTVGESVVVDEGGNIYVTGTLFNTNFDANQAYVRKINFSGTVMWEKALPAATDGSGFSSGESLAIDGAGNLYWLANLYGGEIQDGSALVAKMNSGTGESVWTTLVQGGQYAQDITVTGAGQVFVACDNNARITSLSSAGAVLWSFDPGTGGTSLLDLGTFVLVGYASGTVGAYNYSGDLLWINQVFDTNNIVWGLASDGTDWYAADVSGYIMKISGADNSTILWQKHINRDGTGGNMFLTWIEWSDGYLYAGGTGNDGSGSNALITVKILASDGTLTWARSLEATDGTNQWYWYGHHDLAISGSHYLITGYSQLTQSNSDQQVLARLPVDGTLAGSTVGPYNYVNVPALTVDDSDVGGAGYSTPSQPSTVTTTSLTTLNTLVAPYPLVNILSPFTTGAQWTFDNNGALTLPSSTGPGSTAGYIKTLNAYPTLLAYGSGGHGGPELDWMNGDVSAFDNANVLRHTMYLNDGGLYVGFNENGVANVPMVNWNFNPDGGTIFPTLSVQRGDNPSGTISGQTLLFGDAGQEAIISTPDGNNTVGINSQRLVINPGQGYDSGEGGDIYLWAGRGGNGSGTGGDIKIRGGQGGANTQGGAGGDGGYIRIEAGDAPYYNTGTGAAAGWIEMTAGAGGENRTGGYVRITGGTGSDGNYPGLAGGGDANITGGFGRVNAPGGNVNLVGGISANGLADYGRVNILSGASTWIFDNAGNLVLPHGGIVNEGTAVVPGGSANTITLTPSGGGNADQQLLIYPTAGEGNHLHLTSGNLYNTELYLGSDDLYVKLGNNGNVYINANDSIGNTAQWTFGSDGNLTTPGSSGDITGVNLLGTVSVSAAGNVFGNNINSNYDLNAFGNVLANSALMDYLVSSANLQVSGTANVGSLSTVGSVSANGNITTLSAMYSGNGATWQSQVALANVLFVGADVAESYVQAAMINTGGNGSSDWVSYANNGNTEQAWIDMGFTGNTFNDPAYSITTPNDGYIFVQGNASFGGNLILATGNTGTTKDIVFATGGFETGNVKARLYNSTGEFSVVGNILANGIVKTGVFVASTIPTASSVGAGSRAFVTDADSLTFGNLYVGSAANAMPIWSNGTNWYIG
jgi:hypothetical protein